MNKIISPFFTRLYSSLFLAIFMSVFLTFAILNKWNEHNAVEDFVADTTFIKGILEQQRIAQKMPASAFYQEIDSNIYPFDIHWVNSTELRSSCGPCTFLSRYLGVDVYEFESGELISRHTIANTSGSLFIQDKLQEPILLDNEMPPPSFDIEEYSVFILLFVIVVVIGFVLYLPVRKLQKDINHLNQISYQFGQGELTSRANVLAEPLTVLAESFNEMALALSNKVNESQIFAQAVPHELRTPLSRIQLATGILRKKNLDSEPTTLIDNIDQYIEDIDELCTQVIQYSQLNMQAEKAQYKELNINHFFKYRIEQLQLGTDCSIDTYFSDEIIVKANASQLRLVIDNLIKNAVHHSKSKVTVKLKKQEVFFEISVEDDGKGILEKDFETVFIPYARLDNSRNRKTGGLGLGLAITKAAVKQLGGGIFVSNARTGGAIFTVKLPMFQ